MEAVWAGACCPKFCPVLKLGTAVFCEGKSKGLCKRRRNKLRVQGDQVLY